MLTSITKIRVRYAETDRMGYVYYGNYATYFEVARVECMKKAGISYRVLEDSGIMLPVLEYHTKYFKPVFYDDELIIETTVEKMPGTRIRFDYVCKNANDEVVNKGTTTLVFVDAKTQKPIMAPENVLNLLSPYFSTSNNDV